MFKPGDKVRRRDGKPFSRVKVKGEDEYVRTVDRIEDRDRVIFVETGMWLRSYDLMLADVQRPWSPPQAKDAMNPDYYNGTDALDAIAKATEGLSGEEAFCTASVIKYLWRWKRKNGLQDLHKAAWYLSRLIAKVSGNGKG